MTETAGDIIYDDARICALDRNELREILADVFMQMFPDDPDKTQRLSNGAAADALFRSFDLLVTTDEQKARLKELLDEALDEGDLSPNGTEGDRYYEDEY